MQEKLRNFNYDPSMKEDFKSVKRTPRPICEAEGIRSEILTIP